MDKKLYFILTILGLLFYSNSVNASSINYELKIDENRIFHENVTYTIEDNTSNNYLLNILNNTIYFDVDNTISYKKSVINNGSIVIVSLRHDYDSNMIKKSKFLNECFKSFSYDENDYKMVYYAESPFKCLKHADNIDISVITDIPVLLDTADEINENKYVWNKIDKDFMMDLSLGEYEPDSDVLPPIASGEATPSDDIDDWPSGALDLFPYGLVIGLASAFIVITAIIIIVIIKKKKKKSVKEEIYYEE